jgi:hypothetical protein
VDQHPASPTRKPEEESGPLRGDRRASIDQGKRREPGILVEELSSFSEPRSPGRAPSFHAQQMMGLKAEGMFDRQARQDTDKPKEVF